MLDLDRLIAQFETGAPTILTEDEVREVCERVKALLIEENNVVPVSSPVTICGDIHGQFFDLLELFRVGGSLDTTSYVFLGDYVDRGHHSVETLEYLMLLKLKYPRSIWLLRGNHETRHVTQVYGFYDECLRKYGSTAVWRFCAEVFDYLTIGAMIDGGILCLHGGLSPCIGAVDQLRLVHRVQEIPCEGAYGDIVWSDPMENNQGWARNPRGAGVLFGEDVVKEFNHFNDIELIARAHQLAMEGYRYAFADKSLVTVWSAPNYCYRCRNVGAIMRIYPDESRDFVIVKQTEESAASDLVPNVMPYYM